MQRTDHDAPLVLDGLSKRYGDIQAIRDVSFTLDPGRTVGFVGPNGAGKSTTMRSIFGLVRPDAGTISWGGRAVTGDDLGRIGYLPEQRGLYPKMKISDQVAYFAELKGHSRDDARRRADDLLDALGLGDRLGDPLDALSHGNQQRVQLAVAMVHDPEVLVLDEPFNGLDPVAVTVLQDVIRRRAERGASVLFSSHQLDLVEQLCDDVVIIADGTIRADGPVAEVRRSLGRRSITVTVERPLVPLRDVVVDFGPEVTILDEQTRRLRLAVPDDAAVDRVLAAVRTAGTIDTFRYEPPTLTEVFASVTASPDRTEMAA